MNATPAQLVKTPSQKSAASSRVARARVDTKRGRTGDSRRAPRVRSTGPDQSVERILDAAWKVISGRGLNGFSMTDVCVAAGLSRGTLYNHFPTKELLLEAMLNRGAVRLEQALQTVAKEKLTHRHRLHRVATLQPAALDKEHAQQLIDAEPNFVLHALARYLPHHCEVIESALRPAFEHAERKGVKVNRRSIAEIIVRLQMSFFLLPRNPAAATPATELAELLQAALKLPRP